MSHAPGFQLLSQKEAPSNQSKAGVKNDLCWLTAGGLAIMNGLMYVQGEIL